MTKNRILKLAFICLVMASVISLSPQGGTRPASAWACYLGEPQPGLECPAYYYTCPGWRCQFAYVVCDGPECCCWYTADSGGASCPSYCFS